MINFQASCRKTGTYLKTSKWNFMEKRYGVSFIFPDSNVKIDKSIVYY